MNEWVSRWMGVWMDGHLHGNCCSSPTVFSSAGRSKARCSVAVSCATDGPRPKSLWVTKFSATMEEEERVELGGRRAGDGGGFVAFEERSRAVSKKVSLRIVEHTESGNYTAQPLSQSKPASGAFLWAPATKSRPLVVWNKQSCWFHTTIL